MMHVGGYLEYCGDVQYHGGNMINVEGYFKYHGVFITMGDIMSTMGLFSTVEGYHPLQFVYHGAIS